MGNDVEVYAWISDGAGGYYYTQVWGGRSLIKGLLVARQAKRTAGCVKIEWRG